MVDNSTGSIETLVDTPKKLGLDIRNELLAYHRAHYSANQMTLVIVGKEPVEKLEEWAREYFSPVPNSDAKRPSWSEHPLPAAYLKVIIMQLS